MSEITEKIIEFRDARDWKKYHKPKNLALSLIIEMGELFEIIQWQTNEDIENSLDKIRPAVEKEIADVSIYLFLLAHELGIDLENAIPKKISENWEKYPVGSLTDEEIKWGKSEKTP
ncbi:MAG: nucleotide pyrophosphohydrolase [Candidatus Heimdallarchaeota archaeon]|nr:nucleotide pyrophosphohydrolase [Candidatus Heimdallarchaeota archaeon]MCK4770687.1 nucleotide pyrophosphohydrolase [Candidatus Heimdallarchaeota archaeon]